MVSFICDACGQTVKKNRVEKHYQSECPSCSVLSCIDCGKDFHGDAYAAHTSCISEAEKYQGKLYKPKEKANKGDVKQQEWIKKVQESGDTVKNPKLKGYLNRIQEYSNVPRKKSKFINFCKNSLRVYDLQILEQLWDTFNPKKDSEENGDGSQEATNIVSNGDSANSIENYENETKTDNDKKAKSNGEIQNVKKKKKRKMDDVAVNGGAEYQTNENKNKAPVSKKKKISEIVKVAEEDDCQTSNIEVTGKFSWQKAIKTILKEVGEDGISLKKLQKKVISAYTDHGANHQATTKEECSALFKRKLDGYRKAKISKERVYFNKK